AGGAPELEIIGHLGRYFLHRKAEVAFLFRRGDDFLLLQLGDGHRNGRLFFIAQHFDIDLLAGPRARDDRREIARILDLRAVEFHDHVADLEPRALRRVFFHHVGDERAARTIEPERARDVRGDILNRDAEPAARDLTLALQLRNDVFRGVDRRPETDAEVAAATPPDPAAA